MVTTLASYEASRGVKHGLASTRHIGQWTMDIAAEAANLMKLHVRPRQRDGVEKFNEAPCQTASAGWRGEI